MKRVAFLLGALLCTMGAYAQVPDAPFGISVTALLDRGPENERLERHIVDVFRRQLREDGIPNVGRQQLMLLIDARVEGPEDRIALSVTQMSALPEEVIELGVSGETFFTNVEDLDLPEADQEDRQYMSRAWLSRFHQVVAKDERVFPFDQLEHEVRTILADVQGE